MIVKKMKNKMQDKSLSAHIQDTINYIKASDELNPEDKILWTGALHMASKTSDDLISEMIQLASKAQRSKNPMDHILLSFRQDDEVTEDQVKGAVDQFMSEIGYGGCQVVYAVHRNTNNIHIHMVVNRVDPDSHICRSNSNDVHKMHRALTGLEKKYGWSSEERERYVMVDDKPVCALYVDSTEEITIPDNARKFETHQGEKSMTRIAAEDALPILKDAQSWPELHDRLAAIGFVYEKKGGGAILRGIKTDGDSVEVKPSSLAKWASLKHMEKRIGTFTPKRSLDVEPIQPQPMPGIPEPVFTEFQEVKAEARSKLDEEYSEFERKKEELAQDRKEILTILQNPDLDWRGKDLALAAFHKVAKQQHLHDMQSLVERYKEKLEKHKELVTKATDFEIWINDKSPDMAKSIISCIEQAGNKIIIESNPIVSHTVKEKIALFEQYHSAVQADRYRITAISKKQDISGKNLALILDKDREGFTRGYTPEQIIRCIGNYNNNELWKKTSFGMTNYEERDEHLYYTPISDHKVHFFIDDLTSDRLLQVKIDGLSPACIIESSPGNYQAIFTLDRIETEFEPDIINALAEGLNVRYGDVGLCGAVHPHRAPGFWNVKDKYRINGQYPIVSIIEAPGGQCSKLKEYVEYINGMYEYKKQLRNSKHKIYHQSITNKQLTDNKQITNYERLNNFAYRIYEAHKQNILKMLGIPETSCDMSRLDKMIAIRLRGTKHTQNDIENILFIANTVNGRQKHDLQQYCRLTAKRAYDHSGDMELERFKIWIGQWQVIERDALQTTTDKAIIADMSQDQPTLRQSKQRVKQTEDHHDAELHTSPNEAQIDAERYQDRRRMSDL